MPAPSRYGSYVDGKGAQRYHRLVVHRSIMVLRCATRRISLLLLGFAILIELVRAQTSQQEALQADSKDLAAFSSLADAEVSSLREGITLARWLDLHKGESWEPSTDEAYLDCRTFTKTESLSSGREVTRMAYFYPPQAPTPAVFPSLTGEELINHDCVLAMVRVLTPIQTWREGQALEHALELQLAKTYGIGVRDHPYSEFADAAHWKNRSVEISSVFDPPHAIDLPDHIGADSVFVLARLPMVHEIEQNACCRLKEFRYRSIENAQFHRALGIAGVETSLTERVARLFEALFRGAASPEAAEKSELRESRAAVLPALRDWLNAVSTLPSARHAAGMYAADRLLIVATDTGWQELSDKEKPELRVAFEAIGASFGYDELGGSYCYAGNWLNEARELDPDGTVGQMAVLVSLARGGAPVLDKTKGEENKDTFRTVVVDGEWLLAKNPDPATAAQIHFIMGDAYSDVVALAGGAEPDYGDPAKYQPEADSARKKALEHYRAGLAVDGTSENAKDAWLQAWHLSAGLLPTTRYVYIYD